MHRLLPTIVLLILCAGLTGCTVCDNVVRNVCVEPRLFNWKRDCAASHDLYLSWARRAWREVGAASAASNSDNYAWGFRVGFADYVFAGGNGQPPVVPPRQFWNAGWRKGRGKQAADEWFAGYRHGVQVAQEGGYREQAVLRTSFDTAGYAADFAGGAMEHAGTYPMDGGYVDPGLTSPEIVEAPYAELMPSDAAQADELESPAAPTLPPEKPLPVPEDLPLFNALPRPAPKRPLAHAGVPPGHQTFKPLTSKLQPAIDARATLAIRESAGSQEERRQPNPVVPPNPFLNSLP